MLKRVLAEAHPLPVPIKSLSFSSQVIIVGVACFTFSKDVSQPGPIAAANENDPLPFAHRLLPITSQSQETFGAETLKLLASVAEDRSLGG